MAIEPYENGSGSGFAFLAGVLVGAAAGVLLAPQAGRDTRRRLQEYAQRGKEELDDMTHDTREQLREGAQRVREGAQRVVERGQQVVRENASAAKDAIRSGQDAIRAEKERLLGEKHQPA
jgi:gas vesicle protein